MLLSTRHLFAWNSKATLRTWFLLIVSWSNLSTRFHLIWIINESFNSRAEELQSFWLHSWVESAMALLVVLARTRAFITVTITFNYVLNTIWRVWNSISRWILPIFRMSSSCCHYPTLFILHFLSSLPIFVSCRFSVPLHSRCEHARSVVLVQGHNAVCRVLVVAWTRIISSLLTLYRNHFFGFVSWHHPSSWSLSAHSHFNFIIARSNLIFLFSRKHFLSVLLPNQLTFFVFFISEDIVVRWNRWWIWKHRLLRLVVPCTSGSSSFYPFRLLIVLTWTGLLCIALCQSTLESLHFRGETGMRFH